MNYQSYEDWCCYLLEEFQGRIGVEKQHVAGGAMHDGYAYTVIPFTRPGADKEELKRSAQWWVEKMIFNERSIRHWSLARINSAVGFTRHHI